MTRIAKEPLPIDRIELLIESIVMIFPPQAVLSASRPIDRSRVADLREAAYKVVFATRVQRSVVKSRRLID